MRILSQDLKYDFPYEKVCIERTDNGKIYAQGNLWGTEDNYIQIAEYSTKEKVVMALEMLRDAYMAHVMYKSMTEEQKACFVMSVTEKQQGNLYGIFKFPADNEIET